MTAKKKWKICKMYPNNSVKPSLDLKSKVFQLWASNVFHANTPSHVQPYRNAHTQTNTLTNYTIIKLNNTPLLGATWFNLMTF